MQLVIMLKGAKVPIGSISRTGKTKKIAEGKWVPIKSEKTRVPGYITTQFTIPPAWVNVQYFNDKTAKLLVKGEDAKGRTQYLYNSAHVTAQSKEKFSRINALNKAYDGIVQEVSRDVKKKLEPAMVLSMIMTTGVRPGSEKETKATVDAYGATSLEGRHVRVRSGIMTLEFVGKKGIDCTIPVHDQDVRRFLLKKKRAAGKAGRLFAVTGDQLLKYTHSLGSNAGFQSKDFRTHLGTIVAMRAMKKTKRPATMKEYKKAVISVADTVATQLGNTRKVALSSYINPAIFEKWRSKVEAA